MDRRRADGIATERRGRAPTRSRRGRRVPVRSAGVGIVAAAGLLTGLRSIASIATGSVEPLLHIETAQVATLGVRWSERALWPETLQGEAGEQLMLTVAVLLLACALAAILNTIVVLAEGAAHRRSEYAVRSALGEPPEGLRRSLLTELRTLALSAVCLGVLAGVALGSAMRVLWPHALAPFTGGPLGVWDLVAGLLLLLALTATAHLGAAKRATTPRRAIVALRAGDRVGADPAAIFFRNGLAAFHLSAAGATAIAAITLIGAARVATPPTTGATAPGDVAVLTTNGTSSLSLAEVSARIRGIPGIEAESLASPGALLGLGIRDIVVTQCGDCWRGLFPAPLWNEVSDHHAVGAGYFAATGVEVVEGRGFLPSDDEGSEPVAIVDISLARTAFEDGRPIGRKLRVGTDYERWYTVVGVVDNPVIPTPGGEAVRRMTVWLSSAQQPVDHPRVLLAGTDDAVAAAAEVVTAAGLEIAANRSLLEHRAAAAAPLRWASRLALFLGVLVSALVVHGLWITAVQTTARRFREVALRQALGATRRGVLTFVLGERLRVTGWGLAGFALAGPAVAAAIHILSGVPVPGAHVYLLTAVALALASALASVQSLRDVVRMEPRALLDG